jgi:hypothetical protein
MRCDFFRQAVNRCGLPFPVRQVAPRGSAKKLNQVKRRSQANPSLKSRKRGTDRSRPRMISNIANRAPRMTHQMRAQNFVY